MTPKFIDPPALDSDHVKIGFSMFAQPFHTPFAPMAI